MYTPELPFDEPAEVESALDARDRDGRTRAVDPRYNVALEASAGTGKTRVLVDRYVNLLKAEVDPSNILAVTFTRKAAAEMRERIVTTLRTAAERGEILPSRWRELRDRLPDVAVSTIDAFCLGLLREFPLEADLDPGFSLADETEALRLGEESLDRTLRICRELARSDEAVALVFAQLGDRRARRGLAMLLSRRTIAGDVLGRFVAKAPVQVTVQAVAEKAARGLIETFEGMRGGLDGFLDTGPLHPAFYVLSKNLQDLRTALQTDAVEPAALQTVFSRVRDYFLTREGQPRRQLLHKKTMFPAEPIWRVHRATVIDQAPDVARQWREFKRELNAIVARGTWRMFRIAEREYRRELEAHAVLDFPDVLHRAVVLLRQMEEFAQSRFRLESRYHHVLVDEFQDTSRAQWELLSLLVQAWGAGVGAAHEGPLAPSIFIVGDRKQSIYGFRDADVALLQEAARYLELLRPGGDVRRSISRSFRASPPLLAFINDLCADVQKVVNRRDAFAFDEQDRFPVDDVDDAMDSGLGIVIGENAELGAAAIADEVGRLLATAAVVRDRDSGVRRPVRPGDIAILFRTRESHRAIERELQQRCIPSHVHQGLGFFDAEEVQDARALLWYLADPASDLRAAACLRSRLVRISDEALRVLTPALTRVLFDGVPKALRDQLSADDRAVLDAACPAFQRWHFLADRIPPAELLDRVLQESAYAVEMRGPRFRQAHENLKKLRALVRRLQNGGYATLARVSAHLDHLAGGDEANAPIEAHDAVALLTIHAAKGLEFPIVFVAGLMQGTAGSRDPIRIYADPAADDVQVSVGDFIAEEDDDRGARDREETKRLLYVAVTRARDRLYLQASPQNVQAQVPRGSLAEVLPLSFLQVLLDSGATDATSTWTGPSGQLHRFVRCRPSHGARPTEPAAEGVVTADVVDRDVLHPAVRRSAATDGPRAARYPDEPQQFASDRIVGRVVHRLIHRRGFSAWPTRTERDRDIMAALRREERVELEDLTAALAAAGTAYEDICQRPDVATIYADGRCFHEVPFSLHDNDRVVRGVIDCLVHTADGRLVVLEFKTGHPRPADEDQVALYCQAARHLFPTFPVESRLVYVRSAAAG